MNREFACMHCGDLVHMAPMQNDEWGWADRSGNFTGLNPSARHLPNGDVYAHLNELAGQMDAFRKLKKSEITAEKEAAHWANAREYSGWLARVNLGFGTWHCHRAPSGTPSPFTGETREHCSYPAWLRPSGWQCRVCNVKIPADPAWADRVVAEYRRRLDDGVTDHEEARVVALLKLGYSTEEVARITAARSAVSLLDTAA